MQKIILKDKLPYTDQPNAHLEPVDFEPEFDAFVERFQPGFTRALEITDFLSWKFYPKVFEDTIERFKLFGDVSKVPTKTFFYGLSENEETIVEVAPGKRILVKLLSIGPADSDGIRTVFFMVNGQTRNVQVTDRSLGIVKKTNPKALATNPEQLGAPLQGWLLKLWLRKART